MRTNLHLALALWSVVVVAAGCAKSRPGPGGADGGSSGDGDGGLVAGTGECDRCHGSTRSPAPPFDLLGRADRALRGVGAHASHGVGATLSAPVRCQACHLVPQSKDDPGHMDSAWPAEVTFSELALAKGANPTVSAPAGTGRARDDGSLEVTCSGVYCHGATLRGGTATAPIWNRPADGSFKACDACHGNPPALTSSGAAHPRSKACGMCHTRDFAPDGTLTRPELHVNGTVEVEQSGACNSCHGSAENPAPPYDTLGRSDATLPSVGAHQSHLQATLSAPVPCGACHRVPASVDDPGHIGDGPAPVIFSGLATRGGASPTWSHELASCASTYCHGSTLGGGQAGGKATAPLWTQVDGSQKACDSCHGAPPPAPHPASPRCSLCHPQTVEADDLHIKDPARHVDGQVDVQIGGCNSCHGSASNAAPPHDTSGRTDGALPTVGAHQTHLAPARSRPVACAECHTVPTSVDSPGHADGAPAAVIFGALSRTKSASPAWDRGAATCASTYCHAVPGGGGALTRPLWTKSDGSQTACGSCHANPPPPPHANSPFCSSCHDTVAADNATIAKPSQHIDGVVQVAGTACNACHGSAANAAPPADTKRQTDPSLTSVGAHQSHLSTQFSKAVECSECHVVPSAVDDPGHLGSGPAQVVFGPLSKTGGKSPAWDHGAATCASTWCHAPAGAGDASGGSVSAPRWTKVDGSQAACGTCHGLPPPTPHVQNTACSTCHDTVDADRAIVKKAQHVDGIVQVAPLTCASCHGSVGGAAPPADTRGLSATTEVSVGAHQAHLSATTSAPVACRECHPVPSVLGHANGAVELAFGAVSRTSGRAPSWDRGSATCASTWCHAPVGAGGASAGGTLRSPAWTRVDQTQDACGTCHANPPPAPHVQSTNCSGCHDTVAADNRTMAKPAQHIDGVVQVRQAGCNNCHGSAANDAPPVDTGGNNATSLVSVGAHQAHLTAKGGRPVACSECHPMPTSTSHSNNAVEVAFGPLTQTGGLSPSWSHGAATCASTWCHAPVGAGGASSGGTLRSPVWTKVDGSQAACGTCHALPPPAPHLQNPSCANCHDTVAADHRTLAKPAQHVDGVVQIKTLSCSTCHGSAANAAPPTDTRGRSSTALMSVGAHQAHLAAAKSAPVACAECHRVPTSMNHSNGAVDLAFGPLARTGGSTPSFDAAAGTCASTWCHAPLGGGGSNRAPAWTKVDGTQAACGTCHSNPPPAPHVQNAQCSLCHDTVAADNATIAIPAQHINGSVEHKALACNTCHGGTANNAPPTDTAGGNATSSRGVGAHQQHLRATTSAPVACSECHAVPTSMLHENGAVEVSFGTVAKTGGAAPSWSRSTASCASTWCHAPVQAGGASAGGTLRSPVWTTVNGSQDSCGSCHGLPPPAPHLQNPNCAGCHDTVAADHRTMARPAQHVDGAVQIKPMACNSCHGGPDNAAPPTDTSGRSATSLLTVGAHQAHLTASTSAPVACTECHAVPTSMAHSDGTIQIAWGAVARTSGRSPSFDAAAGTCASTWCHAPIQSGGASAGGSLRAPLWTRLDGTQDACGTCHGLPPPAPHVQNPNCAACHDTVAADNRTMARPAQHVDGAVQTKPMACNSCHGSAANAAPPTDTSGQSATSLLTVGAHQAHLTASTSAPVACSECHSVPTSMAHSDGTIQVAWGAVARTSGRSPSFDAAAGTCASTWCHAPIQSGGTSAGGSLRAPAWTKVDGTQDTCGACHGLPPPAPHVQNPNCAACHDTVAADNRTMARPAQHVDGAVQTKPMACNSCHGSAANAAPPTDTSGQSATSLLTVGAHQAHLTASTSAPVACSECHAVPTSMTHSNGAVELTFGERSKTSGLSPSFNAATGGCASTWCHAPVQTNGTSAGGTLRLPVWTKVDGTQDACGTCHGMPPPAPHFQSARCSNCHDTVASDDRTIARPAQHVDGVAQVLTLGCNSCHGSAANPAPPVDTLGRTATSEMTVGAHQAHLGATTSKPVACAECHTVPTANFHSSGTVELTWGSLARTSGLSPAFNASTGSCASTWCHAPVGTGGAAAGGSNRAPIWTTVNGTQDACGTCHGLPPPAPHVQNPDCSSCHDTVAADDRTMARPAQHVDGVVQTKALTCSTCHGTAANAAPPTDTRGQSATSAMTVGAHQSHLTTATSAPVACSECHPMPTSMSHANGALEVAFGSLARTGGTAPSFNASTGSCATTWCHGPKASGGQAGGGTANAPIWTTVDGAQKACGSCHGYPPPAPHPQNPSCSACHTNVSPSDNRAMLNPALHVNGAVEYKALSCNTCHGSAANAAPPADTAGQSATTRVGVGAHQPHLYPRSAAAVACGECHTVPTSQLHENGAVEVGFGSRARTGNLSPTWNRAAASCASTWCHGPRTAAGQPGGGAANTPVWTRVDDSQRRCTSCHAYPPAAPHPQNTACSACHTNLSASDNLTMIDASLHINGAVEYKALTCNTCHGDANAAPPADTAGQIATSRIGVGAHQAHLSPSSSTPVACAECHAVPSAQLHESGTAEVRFGARSQTGGRTPAWTRASASCASTWCHAPVQSGGQTSGGSVPAPVWTTVNGSQDACGACHGLPPPAPHTASTACSSCHDTVDASLNIVRPAQHVDGVKQVSAVACNFCHGSAANNAPPTDTQGRSATALASVGAHQTHLTTTNSKPVACTECHPVPAAVGTPGHHNGTIDLAWGATSRTRGRSPSFNAADATCASTWCHAPVQAGGQASGGRIPAPVWTTVDGTQASCGACHGLPPPAPHPASTACAACHDTVDSHWNMVKPAQHIDGVVQTSGGP